MVSDDFYLLTFPVRADLGRASQKSHQFSLNVQLSDLAQVRPDSIYLSRHLSAYSLQN
jgi:hypothetical protein